MLKIENTKVEGWEPAIRGMRNPMNSWEKSDSYMGYDCHSCDIFIKNGVCNKEDRGPHCDEFYGIEIGPNDKDLMKRLASAGKDHAKYRRMITVWVDLTAPLYWWKEFDTYKVGTVANSCSTMHKIQAKEFTLDDFSHEHLICITEMNQMPDHSKPNLVVNFSDDLEKNDWYEICPLGVLVEIINMLNRCRELYLETKDKLYWWQMIQLLPSSYNQKRTVMLNYEVLANIYHARKNHKLDCWHTFCDWIESLPESWIITGEEKDDVQGSQERSL